jgi:nitrate reductase gamma subunit
MNNQVKIEQAGSRWKAQSVVIGAAVGALVGAGAAYLLVQRAERNQEQLSITTGDGIRLGLLVFGLLRQVAQLGNGD